METDRPQHRYSAFQRYEQLIAKAVSTYPGVLYCTPKTLALETVVARMRDAANAFIRNKHWESEAVDRKKLEACWDAMEISIDHGRIRIGPRKKREKGDAAKIEVEFEANKSRELLVNNPSEEVMAALMLLHSESVLVDPTRVSNLSFPIETLDLPPNVELTEQGGDVIIL